MNRRCLPSADTLAEFLVCLAAGLAFTAILIGWSSHSSKLSGTPTHDDMVYFTDALGRLKVFHRQGLEPLLADLAANPPHSPFAVLLATASYAFLGREDASPYWGNAVLVVFLLMAVAFLTRGLAGWQRLLLGLTALSFPMTGLMVTEFRPDIAYALFAATGAALILREPLRQTPPGELWAAGFLFAAAFLTKTTTFPLVGAVLATAVASSAGWRLPPAGSAERTDLGRRVWACLAPSLVLALPFYLYAAAEIASYLHTALIKHGDVWAIPMRKAEHFGYYIFGPSPRVMLGWPGLVLNFILAGGLVAWSAGAAIPPGRYLRFLPVIGVAWLIPTLSRMKYAFAGSMLDWLLIFLGILVARDLWRWRAAAPPGRLREWTGAALPLGLVVAVLLFNPRAVTPVPGRTSAVTQLLNAAEGQLVAAIESRLPAEMPAKIFANFMLQPSLSYAGLLYRFRMDGYDNVELMTKVLDPDEIGPYHEADFIVITEPDNPHLNRGLPFFRDHARLFREITADPGLELLGKWPLDSGCHLYLYQPRPRSS